ncbi:hypothetical protein [Arenimonas sp. GDDSR-1]|uniref:hypothetical protein n=1 Tax=Arenimonas sp. GDDSR-1 TaxID=2950125 RepID=UPI00261EC31C|nr:hypothetical protein [Arenimonas sp. GDDSR-1]
MLAAFAAGCSSTPEAQASRPAPTDDPNIEVKRTIVMTGASQCQLKIQCGRDEPELLTPKACNPAKAADGHITEVSIVFDAPCKTYPFKNIQGELYFLDEKSIAGRNSACPVESFNTSYGWALEKS